jgi:hypothetical protein
LINTCYPSPLGDGAGYFINALGVYLQPAP